MAEQKKKKKALKVVLIVGISVVVVFGLLIVGGTILSKKMMESVSMAKETAHPEVNDINSSVTTTGTLVSGDTTTYSTTVSAPVADVKIKEGQEVKKGDVLITFDTATLEDQLDQASLSARSNSLANQSSVDASNKTSSTINDLKADADNLKGQIAAVKGDIDKLNASLGTVDDTTAAISEELGKKKDAYADVLAQIDLLVNTASPTEDITANVTYRNLCSQRDSLKDNIAYLEEIASINGAGSSVSDALAYKQQELSTLEAKLEATESSISGAEAGVLTGTQREQINVSNRLANLQVESASEALEEGKAGILADKDGVIASVDVMKGSMTGTGVPLFSIASTDSAKVSVSLSSRDLETVQEGMDATVTFLGKEYTGKVTYISRIAIASATGPAAVPAEITIDNPDDALIFGLNAKVVIHTASKKDVLTIPNLSINVDSEGTFVYVIEDGLIAKKYVKTGASDIDNTELLEGLDEDAVVITKVDSTVEEGMPAISQDDVGGIFGNQDQKDEETTEAE